jgi:hypothetical protein
MSKFKTNSYLWRIGWYSTGSYFWTKSIVDIILLAIIMTFFFWIINFEESMSVYLKYLYILILRILCSQSLGQIVGIVFNKKDNMALFSTVFIYVFHFPFPLWDFFRKEFSRGATPHLPPLVNHDYYYIFF